MFAGIDTHKDTLAVAVIDTAGRVVHQSQHPNAEDGYRRLLAVLTRHGVTRVGIEGSGAYGCPLRSTCLNTASRWSRCRRC